jgi:CRP/FNR family transcriptional regulator, cyclic AMP receptor protein
MAVENVLRQVPLFADLSDEEVGALLPSLGRRIFAKDAILFHKGSPAQSLYLIESGKVRIFTLSDAGQEITLDVYGPGECFGEMAFADGGQRSTSAVALESLVVYTLPRAEFLRCLERNPQVGRQALEMLARRLEHATTFTENLVFLDVAGRLAAVLLELSQRYGTEGSGLEIDLHLTQTELASWVCASREMVNKVLAAYRQQDLIKIEGQTITLLDPDALNRRVIY